MEIIVAFVIGIIVGSSGTFIFVFLGFMASKVAEYHDNSPFLDSILEQVNESTKQKEKK